MKFSHQYPHFPDITVLQMVEPIFSPTIYKVPAFLHSDHIITKLLIFENLRDENVYFTIPPKLKKSKQNNTDFICVGNTFLPIRCFSVSIIPFILILPC